MKHLLTCLMAAATISTSAQNTDKVLARVRYNFSHLQDTTKRDQVHTEEMQLSIGRNASLYISYFKVLQARETKEMMLKAGVQQDGMMFATTSARVVGTPSGSAAGSFESMSMPTLTDYFFFSKEQKFYTKEQLINQYLVQEDAPKINWKITHDTTSFSGIHCQKATTHFKGRNWIAWYSTELPFQSGPWKLNGLPGLILEAYDDKKEVQFAFAGIEKVTESSSAADKSRSETAGMRSEMQSYINEIGAYLSNEIKLPQNAILTNVKEMDKLKKAMQKDPEGFFKAQMGTGAGVSGSTSMAAVTVSGSFFGGITENNPIEKAEK